MNIKIDDEYQPPSEIRSVRNIYENHLFIEVCHAYQKKHNVEFLVVAFWIERRINEGVDEHGRKYEDVAYYRGAGYNLGFAPRLSHFELIKRYVKHINWMLAMPLDELKIGRGYIVG